MNVSKRLLARVVLPLVVAGSVVTGTAMTSSAADVPPTTTTTPTCTVRGTSGADTLVGTSGRDVICGLGGNDRIDGMGGNDTLLGGDGADTLRGGTGRDVLLGEAGADTLLGGDAADSLAGGAGTDVITTGAGSDVCAVDPGDTRTDACALDSAGPRIGTPSAPATVAAGGSITVTWTVSDAAGVASTTFFLGGPGGWVTWCGFGTPGVLVAGSATSGTYSVTCPVPAGVVSTTYSVFITAQDVFGATSAPASVTDIEVTGGSDDASPPVVSDVVAPTAVRRGETVEMRWRVRDTTGVQRTMIWVIGPNGRFTNDAGQLWVEYGTPEVTLVSGTATDGVYRSFVTVPATRDAGTYTLWFAAADTLGNDEFKTATEGRTAPFTFTVS